MKKTRAGKTGLPEQTQPSSIVKCDVCGQRFNRRYLSSHQRLSHGKTRHPTLPAADESKAIEAILALVRQLSPASRKLLLERLALLSEPWSH